MLKLLCEIRFFLRLSRILLISVNLLLFVYFKFDGKWAVNGYYNGVFDSLIPTLCLNIGILFVISDYTVGKFLGFSLRLIFRQEKVL